MLTDVEIRGFRSVRALRFPLRRLTVFIGGNGVGKTNLYRSLQLLHCAAAGTLADEIARDGGLGSVFWAGGVNLSPDGQFDPKYRADGYKKGEKRRLSLNVDLELDTFDANYGVELGFPGPNDAALPNEAQVKHEHLTISLNGRKAEVLERDGSTAWVRGEKGTREDLGERVMASETALSMVRGARAEISAVRELLTNWRFFHGFRTDADSPLRRPCRAITAPLLAPDGSNLAAVLATLRFIRQDSVDLDQIIDLAFPGAELIVPPPEEFATFGMIFPETPKRVFWPHELSDGTLHLLALLGALLSYRQPPFIALNEPETSLHPSLLPALARTIAKAAQHAQLWVVTHSEALAQSIAEESGAVAREVIRLDTGTTIRGLSRIGTFEDSED